MGRTYVFVIGIAKHSVQYGEVRAGDIPHKSHIITIPLGRIPLEKALIKALSQADSHPIYILLDDEVALTHLCHIPASTPPEDERRAVEAQLTRTMPDITTLIWGYTVATMTNLQKEIQVVTPVKKIQHDIQAAIAFTGTTISHVDMQSLAQIKHHDPFIGTVISRPPEEETTEDSTQDEPASPVTMPDEHIRSVEHVSGKNRSMPRRSFMISGVVAILVIAGIIFYGVTSSTSRIASMPAEPTPKPLPSQTPVPTEAIDPSSVSIQILNGSGMKGASSNVQDILEREGFTNTTVGNADSFSHEKTTIQTKQTVPLSFIDNIRIILSTYDIETGTPLDEEGSSDIIITVGKETSRTR